MMDAAVDKTSTKQNSRVVAILLFDEIEVLDFAGPYEVFNVTAEIQEDETKADPPFQVFTVAESVETPIKTRGRLLVQPNHSFETLPKPDILIVPGGFGSRALLKKPNVISWIKKQAETVEILVSICTGALVLAKAGLLNGVPSVTSHHTMLDPLQSLIEEQLKEGETATQIVAQRYVDHGNIMTAGGISAGIDLSLHIVQKLLGQDVMRSTLKEMEYTWTPNTTSEWHEEALAKK